MTDTKIRKYALETLLRIALFVLYYIVLIAVGILTVVNVYQWTIAILTDKS